jgi:hypothetical protein
MSAGTAICAATFATLLMITAAAQTRRFGWVLWLKRRDTCGYIPMWTLFAPTPRITDTRVLWREQLIDGTVGPWHEMVPPRGGLLRAIWNPSRQSRQVIAYCGPSVVQMMARNRRSCLPMLELPYLIIAQHMTGCKGSGIGLARQFIIINTQGADRGDCPLRLLFISHWHRLPRMDPSIPLADAGLPEMPDLTERLAPRGVQAIGS